MNRGFSLLELLVVVLIAGILLAIAIPSYQRYVARSHRADAIHAILKIAACLERSRAGSGYYDTSACAAAASSNYYRLRIEPAAQTKALSYRVTAEPFEPGFRDHCGSLSLDQAGTKSIGGPKAALASCWAGK